MTPRTDTLLPQRARLGQQRSRVPGRVVGAEHADNTGDAGPSELTEWHWRHPRLEAGLPATPGNMRMPVNEAGYQALPSKIEFSGECHRQLGLVATDGNNPAAANQHMTKTQILGREDLGIG
jgi:hypothetical protein